MESTYFRNLEVKEALYQRHDRGQNKLEGKAVHGKHEAEHKLVTLLLGNNNILSFLSFILGKSGAFY